MALAVVRRGVSSLTGLTGKCLTAPTAAIRPQIATIVSKALRDQDYKRPNPFPYKETKYGFIMSLMDQTTHRFDENSKVIVVDGPVAVGKTKFAKQVAEDLDMLYVPAATMDMVYINPYGYDMRQLDPQLPESCRSFDENDFVRNPSHRNAPAFQFMMMQVRLSQYIDALSHVLNTGQGVVMDRSVFSDMVFAECMLKFGLMSKNAHKIYQECRKMTLPDMLRPHLVVYLDAPVSVVQQRIKERNLPHEVDSPVLTTEYLTAMEEVYKQKYLRDISSHAQVLVYDWSEEGDVEVVVEDMEGLNWHFEKNDPKLRDWRLPDEWEWAVVRKKYSKDKYILMQWMDIPDFSAPELIIGAEDYKKFNDVWWSAPGMKFAPGFNKDMGDEFILTKIRAGI